MLRLTGGRQAETFLGSLVGFHLRHSWQPFLLRLGDV
jgi:hypothetical protein